MQGCLGICIGKQNKNIEEDFFLHGLQYLMPQLNECKALCSD